MSCCYSFPPDDPTQNSPSFPGEELALFFRGLLDETGLFDGTLVIQIHHIKVADICLSFDTHFPLGDQAAAPCTGENSMSVCPCQSDSQVVSIHEYSRRIQPKLNELLGKGCLHFGTILVNVKKGTMKDYTVKVRFKTNEMAEFSHMVFESQNV